MMIKFLAGLFFSLILAGSNQTAATSDLGAVQGSVLDGDGAPLERATVYALPEQDMRRPIYAAADDQGRFILKDLPAGAAYVSAYKENDGYPYNFFSFFIMPGQQTPKVEVKKGETTQNVLVRLGARAARLNIEISDDDGTPFVQGASLIFSRPDLPGNYQMGAKERESLQVPPVPFRLRAEAKGYETWHYGGEHWEGKEGLISLKSSESLTVSISLHRARSSGAN